MAELNAKRRKTLRIPEFDYSHPGSYFITIVTHNRISLFGNILNGLVQLSPPGEMITVWWKKLAEKFIGVTLGEYIVMPNHFHGIVELNQPENKIPLSKILQWFKTMTTNEYLRGVNTLGWQFIDHKLWQRSYYEHVIRSDEDYENVYLYIQNNPAKWELDQEYSNK